MLERGRLDGSRVRHCLVREENAGELSAADGHVWLGQSQSSSIPWLGTGRPRGGREASEPLFRGQRAPFSRPVLTSLEGRGAISVVGAC